ncbi:4-hydroxythreonine-4-phosphate dehydrogenase PdxA [Alteribacillus sp. YIM 98480]|uniref:4-hydroxythreonine-4-phosphate dehydrogenase PdxA n=1 Tax=Alteribacillus sp. YIM 98480 TaxID=2606599 RepID=UPI00131D9523|nr:4-hydroxythreonine-4-phosphate dehydrogenase PdxA [Alteribacillus sp. YIM 98480]
MSKKPIIGTTMGDVAGVGPEIIVKALLENDLYKQVRPLVIGDAFYLQQAVEIVNKDASINKIEAVEEAQFETGTLNCLQVGNMSQDIPKGQVSAEAGKHAYLFVEKAVDLAKDQHINAICTAPLNKEAMQKGGYKYPGHTEILASLTNTDNYSMMLSAPNLKVIHLTTHVGLKDAIESITPERTYEVVKLAHETLKASGNEDPSIAVCGINPHAGENGLFGYGEEEKQMVPGIEKAQAEGINVVGPSPADTLFFRAARGDYDIVVAAYHDQGHGPVKVLGLEAGINITVGLKGGVIRTSVDHGTAFDIAGKNIADHQSLIAAIYNAAELAPKQSIT